MKIKSSGYGKSSNINSSHKWQNNSSTSPTKSSTINSKHKQKAYISPYSRGSSYNAYWQQHQHQQSSSSSVFWGNQLQQQQPILESQTQSNLQYHHAPPPPLPPMPPTTDNNVPMPPPPSTTPPPLEPDEKLAGKTIQMQLQQQQQQQTLQRNNSISSDSSLKSVYTSAPSIAILNYVQNNNNIPRSQQQQQPPMLLQQHHFNSNMTNCESTNSMSENHKNNHLMLRKGIGSSNKFLKNSRNNSGAGETSSSSTSEKNCHLVERKRRKTTSNRYDGSEKWVLEEALLALEVEKQYSMINSQKTLTIHFPDPEISKTDIQEFSDAIVNIHVISPLTPRFCMVTLKDDANVEQVIENINNTPFGNGFLSAKLKPMQEDTNVKPECIEPRTLYIGNLSPTINVQTLKEKFNKSIRMDIGYAQKMKFTRWAFVKFENMEDAIEAYKSTVNTMMDNRSLIVRFRRLKNSVNGKTMPKTDEDPKDNKKDENDDDDKKKKEGTIKTTTSLVEEDTNTKNDNEVKNDRNDERCYLEQNKSNSNDSNKSSCNSNNSSYIEEPKQCNTPLRDEVEDESILDEQSIDGYDEDDDDVLPSNLLTALPSSVVLVEPSKSTSSIAPPSPLMQEEDAVFEPPMRAEIIMDTPSPSLPSNTPTQDEGTPSHLTEQLLLPSPLLQNVNEDDDEEEEVQQIKKDVANNMPLLDTPQSSLSIQEESLSFDTTPLISGPNGVSDDDEDDDPPKSEVKPFKDISSSSSSNTNKKFKNSSKKTDHHEMKQSTMQQDTCDITCFFNLDPTRVPALLEAETSDEVMARLSNEATPLPSPLFHDDGDSDYQDYGRTPPKSTTTMNISCSLGHQLQSSKDIAATVSTINSNRKSNSVEKCNNCEQQITPSKEKSPAINKGSARKNFSLDLNGFNCYDWSFSEDEFQIDYSDDNHEMNKEIKNVGLLGAAEENHSDDKEEDLSNCGYIDLDEDICTLSDDETPLPAPKRRKKEKTEESNIECPRVLSELEIKTEKIQANDQEEDITASANEIPQENTNCEFGAFAEEDTYALSNEETTLPNCNLDKMTPVNENDLNDDECNRNESNVNERGHRRDLLPSRSSPPKVLSELEIKTEINDNFVQQQHTGGTNGAASSFGSDVSNASTVDDWNNGGKKPLEWTDCELEYDLFSHLNSNNDNFLSSV